MELERHIIWRTNQQYIDAHNKYNATFGYTLAMNGMGDLVRTLHMVYCIQIAMNCVYSMRYIMPLVLTYGLLHTNITISYELCVVYEI